MITPWTPTEHYKIARHYMVSLLDSLGLSEQVVVANEDVHGNLSVHGYFQVDRRTWNIPFCNYRLTQGKDSIRDAGRSELLEYHFINCANEIAVKLGCHNNLVTHHMIEAARSYSVAALAVPVIVRPVKVIKPIPKWEPVPLMKRTKTIDDLIAKDYQAGIEVAEIKQKHSCSTGSIYDVLKERNVKMRGRSNKYTRVPELLNVAKPARSEALISKGVDKFTEAIEDEIPIDELNTLGKDLVKEVEANLVEKINSDIFEKNPIDKKPVIRGVDSSNSERTMIIIEVGDVTITINHRSKS